MTRPIDTETPHHWRRISRENEIERGALQGDADADFGIIGGGFTGLSAALELAKSGARVILLEQYRIGQGASGRNNGQIVPHHSKASPSEIQAMLGAKRGHAYNLLVAEAANNVFRKIAHYDIACDPVQRGWMAAAHSDAALERIRRFTAEWQAIGVVAEFLEADEVASRTGTRNYRGAWQVASGGHLNPYALALGLARAAESEGCTICENTTVTRVSADGDGWLVECADETGNRGRLRADKLIVATNALTGAFWPDLAKTLIPVKVFQGASAPISSNLRGTVLTANQAFGDTRRDIRAYRFDSRGGIVTGGTHTLWHNAVERGKEKLARHFHETFPQLSETPITEYWEGILAIVPDRLPRLMRLGPNAVFAGVYSGRGVALSQQVGMLAARLLTGDLAESDSPVPVTGLRRLPSYALAVQVARFIHPLHRLQDRLGR